MCYTWGIYDTDDCDADEASRKPILRRVRGKHMVPSGIRKRRGLPKTQTKTGSYRKL